MSRPSAAVRPAASMRAASGLFALEALSAASLEQPRPAEPRQRLGAQATRDRRYKGIGRAAYTRVLSPLPEREACVGVHCRDTKGAPA